MSNIANSVERSSIMKTTAVFSKDGKQRYAVRMEWDSKKKSCAIIMTYPSTADELTLDQTTMLVRNNAVAQGFGSVCILNLFSSLNQQNPRNDRVNISAVLNECAAADVILIAYGRNTAHEEEKESLLNMLADYRDKLYTIEDKKGSIFSHPLSPSARVWKIVPFNVEEYLASKEEVEEEEKTE